MERIHVITPPPLVWNRLHAGKVAVNLSSDESLSNSNPKWIKYFYGQNFLGLITSVSVSRGHELSISATPVLIRPRDHVGVLQYPCREWNLVWKWIAITLNGRKGIIKRKSWSLLSKVLVSSVKTYQSPWVLILMNKKYSLASFKPPFSDDTELE